MEVFRDATKSIIKDPHNFQGNLEVLQLAVPHSKELGWPSWVPDWRITDISDVGIRLTGFGASYPAKYHPIVSPDPNHLRVEGIFIGTAIYVSRHHHAGDMADNMEAEYDKCLELLSSYPTGEDLQTVFGLTLFVNQMPQSSADTGVGLVEYARNLLPFVQALHLPRNNEEELARRAEAIGKVQQKGGYNDDTSLRRSCCERRLFITNSGYMGLGNYHMVEGDVIAILFGLSVACVLRPLSDDPADGYAFVGEAYCHGVMNGELVKGLPKGEDGIIHGEEILLR
jgi:hypothetical protein